MLYLNSVANVASTITAKKYAICYEKIPAMQNIPELAPSKELLAQWESKEIDWRAFRKQFTEELRAESREQKSRLKELMEYSLTNDVTFHSPEPNGEQTYRTILEETINEIWQREGRTDRALNLAGEPVGVLHLPEVDQDQMKQIATECASFSSLHSDDSSKTCQRCKHLDRQVSMCLTTDQVVVDYQWATSIWTGVQA